MPRGCYATNKWRSRRISASFRKKKSKSPNQRESSTTKPLILPNHYEFVMPNGKTTWIPNDIDMNDHLGEECPFGIEGECPKCGSIGSSFNSECQCCGAIIAQAEVIEKQYWVRKGFSVLVKKVSEQEWRPYTTTKVTSFPRIERQTAKSYIFRQDGFLLCIDKNHVEFA